MIEQFTFLSPFVVTTTTTADAVSSSMSFSFSLMFVFLLTVHGVREERRKKGALELMMPHQTVCVVYNKILHLPSSTSASSSLFSQPSLSSLDFSFFFRFPSVGQCMVLKNITV